MFNFHSFCFYGGIALSAITMAWSVHASTNETLEGVCQIWARKLPSVTVNQCIQTQLQATTGRSVQGKTLWQRDVIPPDAQWRVLVVGGIHGDELSSASISLHWIKNAQEAPNQTHWRFLPLLNPDGMLMQSTRRSNAHGVDLNRNFPTHNWSEEAKNYWEKRTRKDPRRWPGPRAASEPESQFLLQQIAQFKPHIIVSIHAPYGVLDFDGPGAPPPKLGNLFLDQVGIFPGSLGNYAGVQQGIPVVTIELKNALKMPDPQETARIWQDLRRWMSERLKKMTPTPTPTPTTPTTPHSPTPTSSSSSSLWVVPHA